MDDLIPPQPAEAAPLRRIWPRKNSAQFVRERQTALRALPHWDPSYDFIWEWPHPAEEFVGAQEALSAHLVLPVSVVGPLHLDLGRYHVHEDDGRLVEEGREVDDVYVPLAHTEGGLSASMLRGMRAAVENGGVRTFVLGDRMTRASCFVFQSSEEAIIFSRWVTAHVAEMRTWLCDPLNPLFTQRLGGVPRLSRHALLWEVDTHVVGTACHVLYRYTTGDACGPNMITRNAHSLNQDFILQRFPATTGISPRHLFLEANMGGDKKPSALYFTMGGHGKTVLAEITVREATLRRVLRTRSEDLLELERAGVHGSYASGMYGPSCTPASAIAALFAVTGQDLGMVGTSSLAHDVLEPAADGVHLAIRLAGLEVGTVGGGTGLPYARAYLSLLRCVGMGSVYRLAQIIGAATLCLELSVMASMASQGSDNFASAHLKQSGRA
jgi:hydroxymethylglutaryl-CoA reductase (NADPH)